MELVDRSFRVTGAGKLLLLALSVLLVAGCAAGRTGSIPYAPASFNAPPDSIFASNPDYRLGPSDVVTVAVFRVPELSGDYRVDATGHITLPLVGQTRVQGMTIHEVSSALQERLGSRYYVDPDVTVSLKELGSQRVTVDGSVNAPGAYPLPGRSTLMQVVAMARGTTANANLRRVVVFRQIQNQRMAAAFDLEAIRSAEMEDPVIYGSDIVIVDGNDTRQTWRDVLSAIPVLALFRPIIF